MKKPAHGGPEGEMQQSEVLYLPFDLLALAFWVSADAATDLTAAGVRGLLNSLAAVDATRAEVCSFVGFLEDMDFPYQFAERGKDGSQVLLSPVRDGSGKQLHLTRMTSASAGTQPPGVRNGTGCMRAQRRFFHRW
jgi:hypothetical protein